MVSPPGIHDPYDAFQRERAELERVLHSRYFLRAPKLSRILAYICESYFDGNAEQLKEYSIAVEALGRSPGFDPQADAIVRVDLHLLRKRLQSYYTREGRTHELRIELPAGQYIPEFVANEQPKSPRILAGFRANENSMAASERLEMHSVQAPTLEDDAPVEAEPEMPETLVEEPERETRPKRFHLRRSGLILGSLCGVLGIFLGAGCVLLFLRPSSASIRIMTTLPHPAHAVTSEVLRHFPFGGAPDTLDKGIRIRCGSDQDYVDTAGFRWMSDRDFSGGKAFHRENASVVRSEDPALYENGREGSFTYEIPVDPGVYEVHLLFAETKPGMMDGSRSTSLNVGATGDTIDVASDAGGAGIATMKIYPNIQPAGDGKIHLGLWSSDAFLNAIEILPQTGSKPEPVRVSTLRKLYTDLAGRHWLPDRFFLGGRSYDHTYAHNHVDPPLLSRERFGNFSYSIPVAPGFSYQLTLYMAERYWGPENSGRGGIGTRIFDVSCNGTELLRDFDLMKESTGASAVAIRVRHLQPDATGKLDIRFLSRKNYALINALEVEAE